MEIIKIDVGDRVICDLCGKEWTNSEKSGGILFGTKACCPDCIDGGLIEDIDRYDEQHLVRAFCPKHKSFANWVREDLRQ